MIDGSIITIYRDYLQYRCIMGIGQGCNKQVTIMKKKQGARFGQKPGALLLLHGLIGAGGLTGGLGALQ